MLKRVLATLVLVVLVAGFLNAQDKKFAPLKWDAETAVENIGSQSFNDLTLEGWAVVDTMPNAYGPASFNITPFAYESVSNTLAVVYRRNAGNGSGELWWSTSTDMGATWQRSLTSVQNGTTSQNLARYPSMTAGYFSGFGFPIGHFSWPELSSSFEWLGYGATLDFQNSALAVIDVDPPTFSSSVPAWNDGESIFWIADNQDDTSIMLFSTNDAYTTVNRFTPRQWEADAFGSGAIVLGGDARNGVNVAGFLATFAPEVGNGGWEPGYSRSDDGGATWSECYVIDWKAIPATADFTEMWDWKKGDTFVSYTGDIAIDANGNTHMLVGLSQTETQVIGGDTVEVTINNAVVEFYETALGVWDAKIILENLEDNSAYDVDDTLGNYATPGIGQCGTQLQLAMDQAGEVLAAQIIYKGPDGAPIDSASTGGFVVNTETYYANDIWVAARMIDGEFGTVTNITNTPNMNENLAHLAPTLYTDGNGGYKAFFVMSYELGVEGLFTSDLSPFVYYSKAVDLTLTTDLNDEINDKDFSYELSQNYPNPFNPSTTIKYALPSEAKVTLKVYDMLGQEVAELVNEVQNEGSYNVTFDASNLASGVYAYELNAGNFVSTKKMMLIK